MSVSPEGIWVIYPWPHLMDPLPVATFHAEFERLWKLNA